MSIRTWFRTPRVRRGLAASLIALSAGGLVLSRTSEGAHIIPNGGSIVATPNGPSSFSFTGPGAHGTFALSHGKVLAGGERRLYAELDLFADAAASATTRAPISMAIVLDTSGSMDGEKIQQAKSSVIQLIRDMRDDDEIAFIQYASEPQLIQSLARVGDVRSFLISRVEALTAGGGTNIPPALQRGLAELAKASAGRVRRVVLASDGLDGTRALAEQIAKDSSNHGVTVSTMGIGLDFDASYMGGVAESGRGNFAFVKDGASLAGFLQRELHETASTTIQTATARVQLPAGTRFIRAIGADAHVTGDNDSVQLSMGSMFAGDHRRVILELSTTLDEGVTRGFEGAVSWTPVGGDSFKASIAKIDVTGTSDARAVEESRDGTVLANAMSVVASARQIEAAEAYDRGDAKGAALLIDQNLADLRAAASAAPKAAAPALEAQAGAYEKTKKSFATARPSTDDGKSAVRAAAEQDIDNLSRAHGF